MKLDEGWQNWHAKAGEGLCSGVPQMWENQLFTHRDPQSPPAMGSATLCCVPVPVPLGLPCACFLTPHAQHPGAALCLGCVVSPLGPHREGSMGQHRTALADK